MNQNPDVFGMFGFWGILEASYLTQAGQISIVL